MINQPRLDSQLMLDEGLRLMAYKDQFGHLTIGVGRNLDANPLSPAELAVVGHDARTLPITHDNAIYLLHNDETKGMQALSVRWPWWSSLDDVRARVMVDLVFNMGVEKLSEFVHFLADMRLGAFIVASDDLKNSAWYKEVGNRGPRLVGMVETGKDYTS